MTYSEKLRDPRWQRCRLEIMQYADFRCQICGDGTTTLNVHHSYYTSGKSPWMYPAGSLICICEDCHARVTEWSRGILPKKSDETTGITEEIRKNDKEDPDLNMEIISGLWMERLKENDYALQWQFIREGYFSSIKFRWLTFGLYCPSSTFDLVTILLPERVSEEAASVFGEAGRKDIEDKFNKNFPITIKVKLEVAARFGIGADNWVEEEFSKRLGATI